MFLNVLRKIFSGLYCERDINECQDSPCKNGGTCHNVLGSFKCNCTPESSGDLCEVINFTSIASSSFNITIEEIIGMLWLIKILCKYQDDGQSSV